MAFQSSRLVQLCARGVTVHAIWLSSWIVCFAQTPPTPPPSNASLPKLDLKQRRMVGVLPFDTSFTLSVDSEGELASLHTCWFELARKGDAGFRDKLSAIRNWETMNSSSPGCVVENHEPIAVTDSGPNPGTDFQLFIDHRLKANREYIVWVGYETRGVVAADTVPPLLEKAVYQVVRDARLKGEWSASVTRLTAPIRDSLDAAIRDALVFYFSTNGRTVELRGCGPLGSAPCDQAARRFWDREYQSLAAAWKDRDDKAREVAMTLGLANNARDKIYAVATENALVDPGANRFLLKPHAEQILKGQGLEGIFRAEPNNAGVTVLVADATPAPGTDELDNVYTPEEFEKLRQDLRKVVEEVQSAAAFVTSAEKAPPDSMTRSFLRAAGDGNTAARAAAAGDQAIDALGKAIEALAKSVASLSGGSIALVANAAVVNGTTTASFETRANYHISSDVGFAWLTSVDRMVPYMAANFYFRPINRDIPLSYFNRKERLKRSLSVSLGMTFTSIKDTIGDVVLRDDLFLNQTALLSFGTRITDHVRVSLGGVVYRELDVKAPATDFDLAVSPCVSIAIDWDIAAFFTRMFKGFKQ